MASDGSSRDGRRGDSLTQDSGGFQGPVDFRETTLEVGGMTCETCPATVRKALSRLDGVLEVLVTYEPPRALVRFDRSRIGIEDIQRATQDAVYPSTPVETGE